MHWLWCYVERVAAINGRFANLSRIYGNQEYCKFIEQYNTAYAIINQINQLLHMCYWNVIHDFVSLIVVLSGDFWQMHRKVLQCTWISYSQVETTILILWYEQTLEAITLYFTLYFYTL